MTPPLRRTLPALLAALALAAGSFPAGATPAHAQEPVAAPDPFVYEAPSGWKPERIPFPLGFAPSLPYKGFEQLHFAPGMFDPKSENYFTYLFFWWIEGEPEVNKETLARGLVDYYRGLSAAVGGPKNLRMDLAKVNATVVAAVDGKSDAEGNSDPASPSTRRFTGRLNTFDPFNTGQALALEAEITVWRCDRGNRTVVFFCVSPRARDAAAQWEPMRATLATFNCGLETRDETPTLSAEGPTPRQDSAAESRTLSDSHATDRPRIQRVSGGVLAGKATRKPQPEFPESARAAGVEGVVAVEVTVSETGDVQSARAVSGHPLLRDAAVQAARGWAFQPTKIQGYPVKVVGTITFLFRMTPPPAP